MTVQEAYDFLLQVRRIEVDIKLKAIKRDELETCLLPAGVRYDTVKVQTSPSDQLSEVAAEVLDLDKEITELQHLKARKIVEVSSAIEKLESDNEKMVLLSYYIARMPIKKVAGLICYSTRQTYHFKQQGVQHLAKIF